MRFEERTVAFEERTLTLTGRPNPNLNHSNTIMILNTNAIIIGIINNAPEPFSLSDSLLSLVASLGTRQLQLLA